MSSSEFRERLLHDPQSLSPREGVGGVVVHGGSVGELLVGSAPCAVIAACNSGVDPASVDAFIDESVESAVAHHATTCPVAFATAARLIRTVEKVDPFDALFLESVTYSLLQSGDEFTGWLRENRKKAWRAGRASSVVEARRVDDTLHVTLSEPQRHNAFSRAMRDELREALTVAAVDESITRVVFDGRGSNFSSGGDLAEFGTARSPLDSHLVRTTDSVAQLLLTISARIGSGLECRVRGDNVGAGVELAAFAPRVVATPDATFRLPEVSMGLVPGAGGTVSVTQRIGRHRAALMMLSGCVVDAETALAWGLVDEIVEWT